MGETWEGSIEQAQFIAEQHNAVLNVLIASGMWTGDPPYRGKTAAEQVQMLVDRIADLEAQRMSLEEAKAFAAKHNAANDEAKAAALVDELRAKIDSVGEYVSYYNAIYWQMYQDPDLTPMYFDEWWNAQEHVMATCSRCGKQSYFVMLNCDKCGKPTCDTCAFQWQDGHFCPGCFVGGGE
jgi:ribosomal protein L37E